MNGIKNKLNLQTRVRILVLYDVIKNLANSFDFPSNIEESLKKGIVEHQVLESVYAYYIDENEKVVGKVSFNIDWNTYDMFATTETGKDIALCKNIPLVNQFANWSEDIINYVKEMQISLHVKKVRVFYSLRQEIRNNPIKYKEACERLGCKKSTEEFEFDSFKSEHFDREMSFVSELLPELEIKVENNI